jgi:hypothetical protein
MSRLVLASRLYQVLRSIAKPPTHRLQVELEAFSDMRPLGCPYGRLPLPACKEDYLKPGQSLS